MKKTIIIIGIALITFVIAIFTYFVTGISSTYSTIREYQFSGNVNQLVVDILKYTSTNPEMRIRITDTTGDKKNGYSTYITIETKNIEYSLKFENDNTDNNTSIKLVGVYDNSRNVGGYSKSAKGIDSLVRQFELNVLKPLRDKRNINITGPTVLTPDLPTNKRI